MAAKLVLGLVYVFFSFASGFSFTRLIGNVWLLYVVMPKAMKQRHDSLAAKFDVFNLGKSDRIMKLDKHAKSIEYIAFFGPPAIYISLLALTLLK